MDFSKIPLFSAMMQRMTWLGQRQQVLAQNIANADTIGYAAQDLKEPVFKDMLRGGGRSGVTLATTAPNHIGGAGPGAAVVERAPDTERTTTGNSVVLEDQMMKVSKTAMDFQLTTNLYRKHLAMIKTALGRNGA
jgi:flagellar basal-body rod protein FlgB